MQWVGHSGDGLVLALMGGSGAFVCIFPVYLMRGIGAGDVKLLAVVGMFLGWPAVGWAMLVSLWTAGVFALGMLIWHHGLKDYLKRHSRMISTLLASGRFEYFPPGPAEPAARTLPFVPFIAVGAWVVLYFDR